MTRITVIDDTRRNSELAGQIDAVLRKVAPLVVETTKLSLPRLVRYRVVKPAFFRQEMMASLRRALARDIADLGIPSGQVKAMRLLLKAMGFMPTLVWPLVLGSSQIAADGEYETIVVPQSLRHAGLLTDERYLTQMVSHELVHHLQHAATGGDNAWETLSPRERGVRGDITAFVEGHASWADQEVTRQMYGDVLDHRQAPKSLRYRLHDNPVVRLLGPDQAKYGQGAVLIRHAVTAHGVDLVNGVLKDVALLPSRAEVADPEAWTARIAV